jgi:hypothetical protein
MRRSSFRNIVAALAFGWLATVAIQPITKGQGRADAEFLRKAYDTYRSMVQSSPHRSLMWQYLGPTNISGRGPAHAVADRGTCRHQ